MNPGTRPQSARTMRLLIEELRAEEPPSVDWTTVEERLLEAITAQRGEVRPRVAWWRRRALQQVATLAAAAAVLALVIASQTGSTHETSHRPAPNVDLATVPKVTGPEAPGAYRVDALASGAVVESGDAPVEFALPGVARWVLAPRGRVVVETARKPHVIALEKGSLYADVVPPGSSQTLEESFAVITAGTKVAVRGTAFSVSLEQDRVTVQVDQGTVVVGPTGHRGLTPGRLLIAPARAAFSLDGARTAWLLPMGEPAARLPREGESREPATREASRAVGTGLLAQPSPAHGGQRAVNSGEPNRDVAAAEPVGAASVGAGSVGAASVGAASVGEPASSVVEPSSTTLRVAEARGILAGCLGSHAEQQPGSNEVQITITSTVVLQLDTDARVAAVRFMPPLKPELQERCAPLLFGRRMAGHDRAVEFDVTFSPR